MQQFRSSVQGSCILCGERIDLNLDHPYCALCGGSCSASNRFSSSDGMASYCHLCGDPSYVSAENPLCSLCNEKIKEEKKNEH